MLHQKVVIYIILSAILLYLYYKRCDLAIFASFIVVVLGTLIIRKDFDSVEGMKGKGGGECAKMGFTEPKIVKDKNNDVGESLEKEMKKIKKIADKYWPYDEKGDSNDETEKTSMAEYIKVYAKITKKTTFSKEEDEAVKMFMEVSKSLYYKVNNPDESKREKIESKLSDLPKGYIKKYFIPTKLSSLLEKISKSSELKDQGAKKLAKYLTCLCNHWIAIWTKIDSMATGKKMDSSNNEDKETDEEEEKPKKKQKKATKKKKKSEDDEGGDEGDD
jgi:hypothetical protein